MFDITVIKTLKEEPGWRPGTRKSSGCYPGPSWLNYSPAYDRTLTAYITWFCSDKKRESEMERKLILEK
jgi:hypothetical protein